MLCQVRIIDYLRRHPEQISTMSGDGDSPWAAPTASIRPFNPQRLVLSESASLCPAYGELYLPLADMDRRIISPTAVRQADTAIEADIKHRNPYNIAEKLFLPALGSAARRFAYGQTSVDMARVAIALERYQLAHGDYPESLVALAPQFIAQLPHDLINGQPLQYRPEVDGQFVLYSVGWNEKDDDGEVVLGKNGAVDSNAGDWVWRYPAR